MEKSINDKLDIVKEVLIKSKKPLTFDEIYKSVKNKNIEWSELEDIIDYLVCNFGVNVIPYGDHIIKYLWPQY